VREKYLKSQATEWKYIRQLVTTYALVHYDKERVLIHNGKQSFILPPHDSVAQRASILFQSSWENKLAPFEYQDEQVHC
jgi:DNA mismatch repair ATPase MutL